MSKLFLCNNINHGFVILLFAPAAETDDNACCILCIRGESNFAKHVMQGYTKLPLPFPFSNFHFPTSIFQFPTSKMARPRGIYRPGGRPIIHGVRSIYRPGDRPTVRSVRISIFQFPTSKADLAAFIVIIIIIIIILMTL